ncbi:MAG: hypothetical protein ACOYWZ_22865 [Bacillota bacterium]
MKRVLTFTKEKAFLAVVFAISVLKYSYYGYSYYPLLDDNNMYGVFRLSKDIFNGVLLKYKMYTTRPFAVLLDAYLWPKFWNNLGLVLFIMTVLHFVTCILIYKTFKLTKLGAGIPMVVIFLLLPFGSDATYWLAASSRLVAGAFFMSLSFYILMIYIKKQEHKNTGNFWLIGLYSLIHLVSLGFYEQIIALSFFCTIAVFTLYFKVLRHKWITILPVFNFAVMAFWYKALGNSGNMAARGQLVKGDFVIHTKNVIKAVRDVWKNDLVDLYKTSIPNGFKIILSNNSYAFLILIIVLGILIYYIALKENLKTDIKTNIIKFIIGLSIFVIPFLPFFLINLIWICNRNLFISFIGLGIMIESVLNAVSKNNILKNMRALLLGLIVFLFMTANVYELTYYRRTGLIDMEITSKISKIPEIDEGKNLIVLNTRSHYIKSTAKRAGNCTGSNWALLGALQAQQNKYIRVRHAFPLPDKAETPIERSILENSVILGIDDRLNIFPLQIIRTEKNTVYVSRLNGEEFGYLKFKNNQYAEFVSNDMNIYVQK